MKHKHNHSPAAPNANAAAPVKSASAAQNVELRPSPEEIASVAYSIYMEKGCPEGQELDHWLAAESRLRSGNQPRA